MPASNVHKGCIVFCTARKDFCGQTFVALLSGLDIQCAKKAMLEREKKRKLLVIKYFDKRQELKAALLAADSFEEKLACQRELQKLPRDSAPCRLHNRWDSGPSKTLFLLCVRRNSVFLLEPKSPDTEKTAHILSDAGFADGNLKSNQLKI